MRTMGNPSHRGPDREFDAKTAGSDADRLPFRDWDGGASRIPMLTPDTDVNARQAYADARAVNHRRIMVWRAIVRRVVWQP